MFLKSKNSLLKGYGLSTEKPANDFERLVGSRAAFPEGHTKAVELFQLESDSDAELETAARDDIDYRDIFSEAYGVVEGIRSMPDAMRIRLVRAAIAAATGKIEGR